MGLLVAVNSVLCKMGKLELNFRADSFIFRGQFSVIVIWVVLCSYLQKSLEMEGFSIKIVGVTGGVLLSVAVSRRSRLLHCRWTVLHQLSPQPEAVLWDQQKSLSRSVIVSNALSHLLMTPHSRIKATEIKSTLGAARLLYFSQHLIVSGVVVILYIVHILQRNVFCESVKEKKKLNKRLSV